MPKLEKVCDMDPRVEVYLVPEVDALLQEQDARIAELEKALKFSIDCGLEQSVNKDYFLGGGCGCCSVAIEVPADILETVKSVL